MSDPDFFNFSMLLDRINEIPSLVNHIIMFIIFIVGLEIMMRLFYLVFQLFQSEEVEAEMKEAAGVQGG